MKESIQNLIDGGICTQSIIDEVALDLPEVPNMLIVDDEKSLLHLIASILSTNGYKADKAQTIKEACKEISAKVYDIVFLDLGLPDGSGFTVLEKIMSISADTLVIVITGVHDLQTAVNAIRKGAFDYITKPFTVMLFQDRLNTVIDEWKSRTFAKVYQKYLENLVTERTHALRNTVSEIEHIHDVTVLALGAALDLRDPETEEHCRRVSENSVLLGEALDMSGNYLKDLRWGSYLHDIGKIGIPENILLKNGPLTDDEMEIVRKHSSLGHSMIKNIDFLSQASEVVLYHHEKFDGSGYPLGLRGKDIPLIARIFAIADAFDAMIVARPYREALPMEVVIEEIKKCSGEHFDPDIVDAFLTIPIVKIHKVQIH